MFPSAYLLLRSYAGYVGFFPPRPDQEEEVLTETNLKHGLTAPLAVPVSLTRPLFALPM